MSSGSASRGNSSLCASERSGFTRSLQIRYCLLPAICMTAGADVPLQHAFDPVARVQFGEEWLILRAVRSLISEVLQI